MASLPPIPRLRQYVLAVTALGGGLLVALLVVDGGELFPTDRGAFWVFSAFVLFGELRPIRVIGHGGELAISTTFVLALVLTFGVATAIAVQVIASLIADVVTRKPLHRGLFNAAQYTLSWGAAGGVIALLVKHPLGHHPYMAADLPGIFVGAAVFFLVNSSIVRTAVALSQAAPVRAYLRKDFVFRAWTTAMLAGLAPAVAAVSYLDLVLVPLIVLPMAAIERAAREAARNEYLAHHDDLTGLPNRALFHDRADQAIALARRQDTSVAVMLMDLDRFKEINDTLGHQQGDALLRELGPRLQRSLRDSDTIARLGGDEFAILLRSVAPDPETVAAVAEKVLVGLVEPFVLDTLTLDVAASIGIARFPQDAPDVERLMQRADVAMYRAKDSGGGYRLYAADEDQHTVRRLAMASELRRATEQGELIVHYQPKIDLRTGAVAGAEALVRWQRGSELVAPGEFIPVAEHTGLIGPLTSHVLRTALAQARAWREAGFTVPVAVNLSARSLLDQDLIGEIGGLLADAGLPGDMLELEITESVIMADPARALTTLQALQALGIWVAIDDFGTGYSSLAYLRRLAIDVIKIDRSFVMHMDRDDGAALIVQSIVDLGHNLRLLTVAEGVENQAILEKLRALGCDLVQGFHTCRPGPEAQITEWLRRAA